MVQKIEVSRADHRAAGGVAGVRKRAITQPVRSSHLSEQNSAVKIRRPLLQHPLITGSLVNARLRLPAVPEGFRLSVTPVRG